MQELVNMNLSREMQMMVKEDTKLKRTGSTPVIVQRNRPMKPLVMMMIIFLNRMTFLAPFPILQNYVVTRCCNSLPYCIQYMEAKFFHMT